MTYIDPRGKPLAHLDRLAAWQAGHKPAPVTVEWDLSNRCSLGCAACHFAHTHTRGPWAHRRRDLPAQHSPGGDLAPVTATIRALNGARDFGVRSVVWTGGGEPTLHPHWLDVVRAAHGYGLAQGMYTLGGHFTEETARELAETAAWVVVSLDAVTPGTYAAEKGCGDDRFARACQGVRWLTAGRAKVGVSFLLHEFNWHQASQMVGLGRDLGADYVTLRPTVRTLPSAPGTPVGDRTWAEAALPVLRGLSADPFVEVDPRRFEQWRHWLPGADQLTRSYRDVGCHGIKLNATVTPDLRVWVCPNRREFDDGSCLGDLGVETWADVWARHPGVWTDFAACRALCRLHPVNETLGEVFREREHAQFI